MSTIGNRLIELQQKKERHTFSVPELGKNGNDLTVYYKKLTVREDERLRRKHPEFYKQLTSGQLPSFAALIDLLIIKCEQEDGTALFKDEDRSVLLGMNVNFVTELAGKLLENIFDVPDSEQAEKN
jgi:hypothetical protein|tara:strand:- start:362 stop:739 length:378 start_codon:yes stop_codon:yes gene_type:complete